jgi:hypothetical protein
MAKKTNHLHTYLDDFEVEKLNQIVAEWGTKKSAAVARLIREYEIKRDRG